MPSYTFAATALAAEHCGYTPYFLDIDPETALRRCNAKFERRFRFMEDGLAAEGTPIRSVGLEQMERHWQRAKRAEKT